MAIGSNENGPDSAQQGHQQNQRHTGSVQQARQSTPTPMIAPTHDALVVNP